MLRVERRVVLEEDDAMSQTVKPFDEASPQGRVPVAPRGADGQSEDHEFHTPRMSEGPARATPSSTAASAQFNKAPDRFGRATHKTVVKHHIDVVYYQNC